MKAPPNLRKPKSYKDHSPNKLQTPKQCDQEVQTEAIVDQSEPVPTMNNGCNSKNDVEEHIEEVVSSQHVEKSEMRPKQPQYKQPQYNNPALRYGNLLPLPIYLRPQFITGYTFNGPNAAMLPLYFGNIWELVNHLDKVEILQKVNRENLEFYLKSEVSHFCNGRF